VAGEIKKAQDDLIIQELELGKVKQDEVDAEAKRLEEARKVRTDNAAKDKAERDRIAAEKKTEEEKARQEEFDRLSKEQQDVELQRRAVEDAEEERRIARLAQETEDRQFLVDAEHDADMEAFNNAVAFEEKRKELGEKRVQTEQEIQSALAAAQQANLANVSATIGALGSLFEEGTAASKAAAIAEIAIGTGEGFVNGLSIAQKSAEATGPAAAFAFPLFYAAQIAAVLAAANQAKKILTTVPGGGGGGGTISKPTIQTPTNNFIPVGQQPAGTQLTPSFDAPTTPVRAYVISGDVSTGLEADSRLRNRRTLGG
jgi:hypothetical protein